MKSLKQEINRLKKKGQGLNRVEGMKGVLAVPENKLSILKAKDVEELEDSVLTNNNWNQAAKFLKRLTDTDSNRSDVDEIDIESEETANKPAPLSLEITIPPSMMTTRGMVRDMPIQKSISEKKNLTDISKFEEAPLPRSGPSPLSIWGFIALIILFWFYISTQ